MRKRRRGLGRGQRRRRWRRRQRPGTTLWLTIAVVVCAVHPLPQADRERPTVGTGATRKSLSRISVKSDVLTLEVEAEAWLACAQVTWKRWR